MKPFLLLLSLVTFFFQLLTPHDAFCAVPPAILDKMPLYFEENHGQLPAEVQYQARSKDFNLHLSSHGITLRPIGSSDNPITIRFDERNRSPKGVDLLEAQSNYFIGNNPSAWHTAIPLYRKVHYSSIEKGIDVTFYGNGKNVEYDIEVAPGADPEKMSFAIDGAEKLAVEKSGDLAITTKHGTIRWLKPIVYQEINGIRTPIAASYLLKNENKVAFAIAKYDRTRNLTLDPIITYSSQFGGSSTEYATAVALDKNGNIYLTGTTYSSDFPNNNTPSGYPKVFVVKFNPSGTTMIYSVVFGGNSYDYPTGIAVDSNGHAVVVGKTSSTNFPSYHGFQGTKGAGDDGFIVRFAAAGNTVDYASFIGGSQNDSVNSVAIDSLANAYVTGKLSTDFPTVNQMPGVKSNSFSGAYIAKVSPVGSLLSASNFGSTSADEGYGIVLDASNKIYVTGTAFYNGPSGGQKFPTTTNAYLTAPKDNGTYCFFSQIDAAISRFMYSTFYGGNGQIDCSAITLDAQGKAYVTGHTFATNLPIRNGIQNTSGGGFDAFVVKFDPSLSGDASLVLSTYLGGSGWDISNGIALDSSGNIFVAGFTESPNFPLVHSYQTPSVQYGFNRYAFISELKQDGSALLYSTILGGGSDYANAIVREASGSFIVVGGVNSQVFPSFRTFPDTTPRAGNAFILRLSMESDVVSPSLSAPGATPTILNASGGTVGVSVTVADDHNVVSVEAEIIAEDGTKIKYPLGLANGTVLNGQWKGTATFDKSFDWWSKYYTTIFYAKDGAGNTASIVGPQIVVTKPVATLKFTSVPAYGTWGETLKGKVANVPFKDYKVAVYIYVPGHGGWWSKPYCTSTTTNLATDGSFATSITTGGSDNLATEIAAYLVPQSLAVECTQGSSISYEVINGAIAKAVTTRTGPSSQRQIVFSGYNWNVKRGGSDPGPNNFSDDAENVFVDAQGKLHLKITNRGGTWYSAETISSHMLGKGTYRFYTSTSVNGLDQNVIGRLFTGDQEIWNAYRELAVEFSRTGKDSDASNAQFGVQPVGTSNFLRFNIPSAESILTHTISWLVPGKAGFMTAKGFTKTPPSSDVIKQWTYAGSDVIGTRKEKAHINLWLSGGQAPTNGQPSELVVDKFEFSPSRVRFDFNNDGYSDFVFRDTVTKEVTVWFMQGETKIGSAVIPNTRGLDWNLVGITDLNGDGYPDLAWQNPTGTVLYWLMVGTQPQAGVKYIYNGTTRLRAVAFGDINGDGHPDLLWQDPSTGGIAYSILHNGQFAGDGGSIISNTDTNWQFIAAPDLNGDGYPELLFQKKAPAADLLYFSLSGNQLGTSNTLYSGNSEWRVVGIPDMNSDGQTDLFWQNTSTGGLIPWYMRGTVMQSSKVLLASLPPNLKVVGMQ